jgi:outer membrane translocation and assembly module TamA
LILTRFILLCCLIAVNHLYGQSIHLRLEKDTAFSKIKSKRTFKNDTEADQFLSDTRSQLIHLGYWEASFDTIYKRQDTLLAFLHIGPKYEVRNTSVTETKKNRNKVSPESIYDTELNKERLLRILENNGYPFARIENDSMQLRDDVLHYKYNVSKGKYITIDSFINHGKSKLTKGFIQNYVLLKSKQPYNESKIRNIDKLLQKLPYATIRQQSSVLFRDDKADIHLYLDKRKVNSFDFLVGFLPGSNNGKILITGEVRLHLQNAFKRGEEIFLQWRRLQPQSQLLDIRFNYPYLFNVPIGINFTFNLEKRDSSSLDLGWQLGLPYITSSNNYIKGFYKYFQTFVLAPDTTFVKFNKKLPINLDAVYNQYGVQAYYENLDYLFNPQKGYDLKLTGSIGVKKIRENNQITSLTDPFQPDFDYSSLYDSIRTKSIKGDLFWNGNYYLPLGKKKRHILKFSLNGGAVFNQSLLRNELLRIGGNKLLRGFDEQSILASTYNVTTLEYRMMILRNSYFFIFFDAAYIHRKFNNTVYSDFPFGFGTGVTFETKIGIFGLTYALGQQKNQPVDFRKSKLHFGYVAVF